MTVSVRAAALPPRSMGEASEGAMAASENILGGGIGTGA
jgi:hypothetical protein